MMLPLLAVLCGATAVVYAADPVLRPSAPSLDRPTLTAVSIRLPITGDDNHNSSVAVRYRVRGTSDWFSGIPLYRVRPETVVSTYIASPQFAGSIFDLRPATTYEIELNALDPDGPVNARYTLYATTRPVPADPAVPRIVNVSSGSALKTALSNAQPGDIITLADGVYTGTYAIGRSGTASNPIVIRGASRDNTIIDGLGCAPCNILEIYASYVHVERLTLRNAERAIRFQTSYATANVVRRVRIANTNLGIGFKAGQTDFYVADNILEGRLRWPITYASNNGANGDNVGIGMSGSGHVVAHNQITGYSDSVSNHERGWRDSDIYGNDVLYSYDNAIELDNSDGNVRCLRNRFTNAFMPLSTQVVYAGPAYIIRNVGANIASAQIKVHGRATVPEEQPNGLFVYHNSFVSGTIPFRMDGGAKAHHLRFLNNLFIGPPSPEGGYAFSWYGPVNNAVYDYNGYWPDGTFRLASQTAANHAGFRALGREVNGRILTGQILRSGLVGNRDYSTYMQPQDFTLAAASAAIDRGVVLPGVNDGFAGAAPDLGALESGCAAPIYGPRPEGTDERNQSFGCTGSAIPAPPPPTPTGTASFVKIDTSTQGSWRGVYGADGHHVIGTTASHPSYVSVTPSGNSNWVWASTTAETRATQKPSPATDRIAACWYSGSSFKVDLSFADSTPRQVALYLLDWDKWGGGRSQKVEIVDSSGNLLDARTVSGFSAGQYLVWNLSGRVSIRITNANPSSNAVVSGLFFGGASAPAPTNTGTAAFVKADTTTQGSWKGVYGADGYNVIGTTPSYPSYVSVVPSGHSGWVWASTTAEKRGAQKPSPASDRIAACWYSGSSFKVDLSFADSTPRQVALYLLDWDKWGGGRSQKVEIVDSSGNLLDARTVSGFSAGQYLVWNLSGRVSIRVTNTNFSSNAAVSGLFFGGASTPSSGTASFVKTDTATQGSWKGVYGADGHHVIGATASYPSHVSVAPSGNATFVWANPTSETRATQKPSPATDRIAACWYSGSSFKIDLSFSDGAPRQVALYLLDWDKWNGGRSQRVEILDSNGNVLDSRSVSGFSAGQYLVWNLSGRVSIRVINSNPSSNAVVSGLFFR